jgi:hypothetical protein
MFDKAGIQVPGYFTGLHIELKNELEGESKKLSALPMAASS